MEHLIFICFLLSLPILTQAQTEFDLDPSQSMLMTGKGTGQDGTINPFNGEDCNAIIENLGSRKFSIRIQKEGNIIDTITIFKNQTKKIKLLKDQELYLDPNPGGKTKARVDYEKLD